MTFNFPIYLIKTGKCIPQILQILDNIPIFYLKHENEIMSNLC